MRPAVSAGFAKRLYQRHHGAKIGPSYLTWCTVNAADGKPLAVLGYRAADDPLFLESYLSSPIEDDVMEVLGAHVGRNEIVEIGGLAALPSAPIAGGFPHEDLAITEHAPSANITGPIVRAGNRPDIARETGSASDEASRPVAA